VKPRAITPTPMAIIGKRLISIRITSTSGSESRAFASSYF